MFVRSLRSVALRQLPRGQLRRGMGLIPMLWRTLPMIQIRGIQFGAIQPDQNGDVLVPSEHVPIQQPNSVSSFEEALQSLKVGFSVYLFSTGVQRSLSRCQFESARRLWTVLPWYYAHSVKSVVQCPFQLYGLHGNCGL